jgi:hypothetical protein
LCKFADAEDDASFVRRIGWVDWEPIAHARDFDGACRNAFSAKSCTHPACLDRSEVTDVKDKRAFDGRPYTLVKSLDLYVKGWALGFC